MPVGSADPDTPNIDSTWHASFFGIVTPTVTVVSLQAECTEQCLLLYVDVLTHEHFLKWLTVTSYNTESLAVMRQCLLYSFLCFWLYFGCFEMLSNALLGRSMPAIKLNSGPYFDE
jgi:hypothetical protein